jgi:hypothetical protein
VFPYGAFAHRAGVRRNADDDAVPTRCAAKLEPRAVVRDESNTLVCGLLPQVRQVPERTAHLGRCRSALDVSTNTLENGCSISVVVEPCDVELELSGVPPQIGVLECLLAMEEQFVHVREPVLDCGCLSCSGCREGVRVDLDEREVAVGETDSSAQLLLDAFDLSPAASKGIRSRRTR